MKVRAIPPLNELRSGQLADYYEVIRDDRAVFIARAELTPEERQDIIDRLREDGVRDMKIADAVNATPYRA